jgi:hypothetical protein
MYLRKMLRSFLSFALASVLISLSVVQPAVALQSQSVIFTQPAPMTPGLGDQQLSVSSTSGLEVLLSTSTPAICSLQPGAKIRANSVGTCILTASQSGNHLFSPAKSVTRNIKVSKLSQTLSFTQPLAMSPVSPDQVLVSTSTSELPVTFVSETANVCSIVNSNKVRPLQAGNCRVTASQAGNQSFASARSLSRTFKIAKLVQTISFSQPVSQSVGGPNQVLNATATSSLVVSFASASPLICSVGAENKIAGIISGTCKIVATQEGNLEYLAAKPIQKTLSILKMSQTISFSPPTSLAIDQTPYTLTATSSSSLTPILTSKTLKICTVSNFVLSIISSGICVINANQSGNQNYMPAVSVSKNINILKEPLEPMTFDDLVARPKSISYWAWKKSSVQVTSTDVTQPTLDVIKGPNTELTYKTPELALLLTAKLYPSFSKPSHIKIIYYSYQDIAWAQSEFSKYVLYPSGIEASRGCATPDTCWGALAEIDLSGMGVVLIALKDLKKSDMNHTTGTLESHEYSHTIQMTQFVDTAKEGGSYCCIKVHTPWWMVEGGATFTQAAAVYFRSFDEYSKERRRDANEFLSNKDGVFTKQWIEYFLEPNSASEWGNPVYQYRIYDAGFLALECLVALKGPGIQMQLFKEVADGATFSEAFERNFGVSWQIAKPKIAQAISLMLDR